MTARFLLDRTSENLLNVFPGAVLLTDFGLDDDADDEADIFPVAWDSALTIVTENDRHFIAAMRRASEPGKRRVPATATVSSFQIIEMISSLQT